VICAELPFQCPYKVPKDNPPCSTTGIEGGGLCPELGELGGLDTNTSDVYAQYRASLALVPCDAQSITTFTPSLINGNISSVSVIFVYDKPVNDLKRWLE
jgi:hypothetical protein